MLNFDETKAKKQGKETNKTKQTRKQTKAK